jgi:hypothetical protein
MVNNIETTFFRNMSYAELDFATIKGRWYYCTYNVKITAPQRRLSASTLARSTHCDTAVTDLCPAAELTGPAAEPTCVFLLS